MKMNSMVIRIIVFITINFAALALGGIFTGEGVPSEWYATLNKAPWTPPGWVFGFAWTTIMICFSLYMAFLWPCIESKKKVIGMYSIQWILNVLWNPVFFYWHRIGTALFVITMLTLLIGGWLFLFWSNLRFKSVLILPYFIWLLIATSLNGYIYLNN